MNARNSINFFNWRPSSGSGTSSITALIEPVDDAGVVMDYPFEGNPTVAGHWDRKQQLKIDFHFIKVKGECETGEGWGCDWSDEIDPKWREMARDLMPLLWHVNNPMLPGFVSTDTPAGVIGYRPNREQLLLARRYARGFSEDKRHRLEFPILGLYLMGSMGSLGQTAGSDLDFWLRSDGQRRNPGTSADLIAAGLFAALRERKIAGPFR